MKIGGIKMIKNIYDYVKLTEINNNNIKLKFDTNSFDKELNEIKTTLLTIRNFFGKDICFVVHEDSIQLMKGF